MRKLVYSIMLLGAVMVSSGASAVSTGFVTETAATSVVENDNPPKPKKAKKSKGLGKKKGFNKKKKNNGAMKKAHNKKFSMKTYAIN